MSIPTPTEEFAPPPSLLLTKKGEKSQDPLPRVTSLNSLCTVEASIPLEAKKRSGKRTLLFVTLIPIAFIISAFLHHFMRIPVPVVLDEPTSFPIVKREPQPLLSTSGIPNSSSAPLPSQSTAPTTTSPVPTIPSTPFLPTPFPQPFDASLSDNFTTVGCQAFFTNFTQDETFRQCRPVSFLLNTSSAFLQAQRNLTLMNNILSGTCNTVTTAQACDSIMSNYLSQLNNICRNDITSENPVVLQAQIGFQSYTAMRIAGCLPDPSTDAFCYVEAVAAATQNGDIYFFALPLGNPVPETEQPSCGSCVKSVLSVYSQYVNISSPGSGAIESGNSTASSITPSSLPVLSKTYPAAARAAVNYCGGAYASTSFTQSSGAEQCLIPWAAIVLSLVLTCWIY